MTHTENSCSLDDDIGTICPQAAFVLSGNSVLQVGTPVAREPARRSHLVLEEPGQLENVQRQSRDFGKDQEDCDGLNATS